MDREGDNKLDWLLVALLTAVGLGLRLAYLFQVPPFLDEYSSMLTGLSILRTGGVPRLPSGVLYPSGSLFSYLEAVFFGLFGFSDFVARLPTLLISILTLPILYLIAHRLFNRRVALLSVALLALAPEAVVWGARARMYALLQLLVLLTMYFFYRAVLDSRTEQDSRDFPGWAWSLTFLAAIFSQDEAILLLPILWFAALVVRGPRWFTRPAVLLSQVLLPVAGVAARFWLNEIRVPGEVYTLVHDAFFRFPPALEHGLKGVAPFFAAPSALPITLFFLVALVFASREVYASWKASKTLQLGPGPFLAYIMLAVAAAIVLVVNTPWQDDRYLFMVLPLLIMVSAWGLDRLIAALAQHWPLLQSRWVTPILVAVVALLALPGGLSATARYEPDYSAAYRWLASQIGDDDMVASVRPAPAAVYLGRADVLASEDKHQEFIMRLDGEWIDRWAGAQVIESPEAFRDDVLNEALKVWLVVDEDRFESAAFSPEFIALILDQMELAWHDGGVLVFRGQGYEPPPEMAVDQDLDANFDDQLRLTGYAISTEQPKPGQEVVLDLSWQAIQPERNYTVFVHLVGTDGQGLTQLDGEPFLGLYSMVTHWPRDRAVIDTRNLAIPVDTAPGRYRLEIGLYDADDTAAGNLPVLNAAGEPSGDSLTLGFLHVLVPPAAEPSHPVEGGNLGGVVSLVGYDPPPPLQVEAGASLSLTLTWQCLDEMEESYTVFVHMVGTDGQPLAQADGQPLDGSYPTNYWRVGEILGDPHHLEIPVGTPPGEYELRVGMYLLSTGERLPMLGPGGQVLDDGITLDPVTVGSP